jgi:outer membrane protein assembly factor BamB
MFRGGPTRTGTYVGEPPSQVSRIAWRVQTGGAIRGSLTVAGRVAYAGSTDGVLYALDRDDGGLRWRYDAGSPLASTPAVASGIAIVTGRDGRIHGVDAGTGAGLWQTPTGADLPWPWGGEGFDYYVSSAAIAGDTAYVGAGDGGVYALDARTGEVRWRAATGGRVRGSPAVAEGGVYAGSADGILYAFDAATGDVRWQFRTVGADHDSGTFQFDRRTLQSSPAVRDGMVFVGSRDGGLYAIDAATGALRWRHAHGTSWGIVSPAVAPRVVYAGTSDTRRLYALDAADGTPRWETTLAGWLWASPAVVGDVVIAADHRGIVQARDAATGDARWSLPLPAAVYSSPVPDGELVFVGADDGAVYALGPAEGAVPRRAVYSDPAYRAGASLGSLPDHDRVATFFHQRGYEPLDAAGLAHFLEARITDGAPSVIVFAMDRLPDAVAGDGGGPPLLRRYLEAGGKSVWLGMPPRFVEIDEAGTPVAQRRDLVTALLGVPHDAVELGVYATRLTPEGQCLGLSEPSGPLGWGIAAPVSRVLAVDEPGRAVAWVQEYGHGPHRGFVRLWTSLDRGDLAAFTVVAEEGVLTPPRCP